MKRIGILTAGGDSPGLNAAIRAVGKTVLRAGYRVTGFRDGFEGVAFDRTVELDDATCSGILTVGGTILHTSRHKPNRMPVGDTMMDMTDAIVANYRKHQLECLVCIGGGGTHKSALLLQKAGLNIVTLPKTIDNDLAGTDNSIGFDSALSVAANAVDSLHSTAGSHRRIMLVEIMGHNAGWLALGSGLAGGADIILIPEIPYRIESVADELLRRAREGKYFNIVPVAEGALSCAETARCAELREKKENAPDKESREAFKTELDAIENDTGRTIRLARELEARTNLETRVTILGYLQRGGSPSCADRLLATRLGSAAARAIFEHAYGVMIAADGEETRRVPLESVAGVRKIVPLDHPWMRAARNLGVHFGE